MQGTPPRRSRRRPPRSGPSLPLVPIVIAVVVLGFVIGAGLSFVGRHDVPDVVAGASPTAAATIPPLRPEPSRAAATPEPSPSPSPSETPSPSPRPSRSPSPRPPTPKPSAPVATPSALPSPTGSPDVAGAATPVATETPSERPTPLAPPAPPKPHPTDKPTAQPTPTPVVATPSATGAPVPATAPSSFGKLAASVVRVYLSSVQRGDRDSAAAELASPPSGALVEDGIVDASTEVRHVEVHGVGDVVTVDVDLHTSAGAYAAQYTVKKSATGAALIVDHSIVKH